MKLGLAALRAIATGCESVREEESRFVFSRFGGARLDAYSDSRNLTMKCGATSGVTLSFYTEGTTLSFTAHAFPGSSRQFWYFDLFIDGALREHFGAKDMSVSSGRFVLPLGDGLKRVTLYFPCLVRAEISDVELDGMAEPAAPEKSILFIGDSITQGYDAVYPSATYPARVSRMLDASFINQGVGAAMFTPGAACPLEKAPDIVFTAFGSNDWAVRAPFGGVAAEYLDRLCASYPDSDKYLITPIWLADYDKVRRNGSRAEMLAAAQSLCDSRGIKLIDGGSIAPHSGEFYTDGLHPNDACFAYMAEGIVRRLRDFAK